MDDNTNQAAGLGGLTGLDEPTMQPRALPTVDPDDQESDEDYHTHNVATMRTVKLGRQGEHLTQTVEIDASAWLDRLPGCALVIACTRPGETEVYLPQISVAGGVITWHIVDQDTALAGWGRGEVRAMKDGKIKKSATFRTMVEPSLAGDGTVLPPAPPDWVQTIIDGANAAQDTAAAAARVEQAALDTAANARTALDAAANANGAATYAKNTADKAAADAKKTADDAAASAKKTADDAAAAAAKAIELAGQTVDEKIAATVADLHAHGLFVDDDGKFYVEMEE